MQKTRLGRTGLMVTRTAFGALPVQRLEKADGARLLRRAYDAGINFFDTARAYSDSEEKMGLGLADVRKDIIIATKTHAADRKGVLDHLAISLANLRTDYVDVLQLHNPSEVPDPNDPESAYAGLLEAQRKGMTRFVGITNHRLPVARDAVDSDLFDTLQFPLTSISAEADLALARQCARKDVGFIAMKALSGGLVTNAASVFAFLRQFDNVVPIWGIQRDRELDEFIALEASPPAYDEAMQAAVQRDRKELGAEFCRGCGYCLPCPADIPINMAARMSLLLRRAPYRGFLTPDWQEKMQRIRQCAQCGACVERCPYGLNPPELLKKMLLDYEEFYAAHAD